MKLPRVPLRMLALTCFFWPSLTLAQDACSVEEVVQPAIDAAAEQNGCNADGVYLSADEYIKNAVEDCGYINSGQKCRRCFASKLSHGQTAFKALIKVDLLDSEALRDLKVGLKAAAKENCETPPAEGTPKPGDDDKHHDEPKPKPSPTPGASPSPNPDTLRREAREAVESSCPCHGQFSSHELFISCAKTKLYELVNHGLPVTIAAEIMNDLKAGTCGSPS
jgi:hypothetical protein